MATTSQDEQAKVPPMNAFDEDLASEIMTAETPVLTSPGSPNAQFRTLLAGRANSTKRDKRLSRNYRPPHSADGIDPSSIQGHSFGGNAQAGPSQPRSPTNPTTLSPNVHQQHLQHSRSLREHRIHSPTHQRHSHHVHVVHPHQDSPPNMSPVRSVHITSKEDDRKSNRIGSSSPHRSPSATTFLSLPLFADGERTRVSSSPMMPPPPYSTNKTLFLSQPRDPSRLNRAQSMREPTRSSTIPLSGTDENYQLPSHRQATETRGAERMQRSEGLRYVSPSASMSVISDNQALSLGQYNIDHDEIKKDDQTIWSRSARRWSSSLPRGRNSAAFAYRLAEGASPYLRAGLEELRSIFDVDSNPIPSSPFPDEDDGDDEKSEIRYSSIHHLRYENSSDAEAPSSSALSRETSVISADADRKMTTSPAAISSRDESPSRNSAQMRRTPSKEKSDDDRGYWHSNAPREESTQKSANEKSTSHHAKILMPFKRPLGLHLRREASFGFGLYPNLGLRQPVVNRRFLAWSLSFVAIGIIGMCAWGYATQSDAFSITLIGFFLTQPAFALAALISLIARKRALMDLFSRAMRAHVLAQALIVVFAYLDLSASSLYSASTSSIRGHGGKVRNIETKPFPIVPTMEMRFGPLYRTKQAGDGPMLNSVGLGEITNSSIHAHDSSVGDWRSRITYFIVFLVQAAAPIAIILVGQYIIGQRLALLARHGSLSRQGSQRQQHNPHESSLSSVHSKTSFPDSNGNSTASTTYGPPSTGTNPRPTPHDRAVPRLQVPTTSPVSLNRRITVTPTLNLPMDGAFSGTHPRHRREERRKRLATSPNVVLGPMENDPFQIQDGHFPPSPMFSLNGTSEHSIQPSSPLQDSPIITANKGISRNSMHRHRRSSSHPVNFTGPVPNSMLSQQIRTGLGMTFEEDQHPSTPPTNSGLHLDL